MWGFYSAPAPVDTDDDYRCKDCNARVLMASPVELRSHYSKEQSASRLCTTCAEKRKPTQFRRYEGVSQ